MDTQVEVVTDRAGAERWQAVREAAFAADFTELPADPVEEVLPDVDGTAPDDGAVRVLRLATGAGVPVAAAVVTLSTADNTTTAEADVVVHPQHRGRGHGRALYAALVDELVGLGRTRIVFESPSPWPSGPGPREPLLRSLGARPVLREARRVLDLRDHPPGEPADTPFGYRLVSWADRAPDPLVDGLAELSRRMSTDAPLEELDWEPEVWDAARYRRTEQAAQVRGRRRLATAVVHEPTGTVAGFTEVGISVRRPEVGYQWATLVLPEHRGHGLGLLLKSHNHRQVVAAMPQTRWLNTWNAAETNPWMVAVNDRLGYRPRECWTAWQLDV